MFTYPGNLHIHTRYSDGSGSIPGIAAAARSAGLNYIVITDHNTLRGLQEEGFYDGVAVLVGAEINHKKCHYLALNIKREVSSDEDNPQKVIDNVKNAGGLGFIAHPFEKGSRYLEGGASYPWDCWPVFNFTGLEIWNYCSQIRSEATSIPRIAGWYIDKGRSSMMYSPPKECLALWDCYTASGKRVVAVGGSDAHAVRRKILGISMEIFSYTFLFRTINVYLVLKEPLKDVFHRAREQIYTALAGGNCYVSYDLLHPGKGFSFTVSKSNKAGFPVVMGDEIIMEDGLLLEVKAPSSRSIIRLLAGGLLVQQADGDQLQYRITAPGVYRVEVYYKSRLSLPRPWIYSNPIYIKER